MTTLRTPIINSSYELHPTGMYAATLIQVVDLGTHTNKFFKDKELPRDRRLVRLTFETTALMTDGRPFAVSKRYTLSHHEKSMLRKDLESWRGRKYDTAKLNAENGFDLGKCLGAHAMLNISHSVDGQFANIESVNPLPAGMAPPQSINEKFVFSIADWNQARFLTLSEKTREMIEASKERARQRAGIKAAPASNPEMDLDTDPDTDQEQDTETEVAVDGIPF